VLLGAVPFVLALALVLFARLTGLLDFAPPAPIAGDAVPLHAGGTVLMIAAVLLIVAGFLLRRPVVRMVTGPRPETPANPGACAATLVVLCLVSLAIWLGNPFAALLLIPALHFWMWLLDPDLRLPALVRALFLLIGLVPAVLVLLHVVDTLGPGFVQAAWNGVLLYAGGSVPFLSALEWTIVLGCLASVVSITVRGLRHPREDRRPVTVRGPVTYAGPGSLGGTESALRR
jgi:hypothetical protein